MKIRGFNYKCRAFADDIMFILEDPLETIPKLLKKIKEFGDFAGSCILKNIFYVKIWCRKTWTDGKNTDVK